MKVAVLAAWALGACAVLGLILWTGAGAVLTAVAAAGWGVLLVIVIRGAVVTGAGLAWFSLFPKPLRPSALTCVLLRFLREGASALLPTAQVGGEAIGARALALRGAPMSLAAASVIVDALVQAGTQFLFALAGLAMLASMRAGGQIQGTIAIVVAVALPTLGAFYLVQRPAGRQAVTRLLKRVVGDREWLSFGAMDALYARLDTIYANRFGLARAIGVHSCVWLAGALEVWAILSFMGYESSYREALVIESLMQAIRGAAFAIPSALGAQEGGLIALCALFNVPAETAIAMSLIKRAPDLVYGIPALVGWQVLEGKAFQARAARSQSGSSP